MDCKPRSHFAMYVLKSARHFPTSLTLNSSNRPPAADRSDHPLRGPAGLRGEPDGARGAVEAAALQGHRGACSLLQDPRLLFYLGCHILTVDSCFLDGNSIGLPKPNPSSYSSGRRFYAHPGCDRPCRGSKLWTCANCFQSLMWTCFSRFGCRWRVWTRSRGGRRISSSSPASGATNTRYNKPAGFGFCITMV